jgi:hypothetical protein
VRGSTLVEKNKEYVQAARVIGRSPGAIMWRHILPNVMGAGAGDRDDSLAIAMIAEATLSSSAWACRRPAVAGHADPDRQRFLFSGEWWILIFPACAGAAGAGGEPAGRLAARRAEPEAEVMKADAEHMPLLAIEGMRVEFPTRRGHVVAVDTRPDAGAGQIHGLVGESGRASRPSATAVMGLLERPGE